MTKYQKNWLTVASILLVVFFGLLFWAALKSDSRGTIFQTIQDSDTSNVESILIEPGDFHASNGGVRQLVTLTDRMDINSILKSLKSLQEKHFTKGGRILWDETLFVNYRKKFDNRLKDKRQLALRVFDSDEGLFVQLTNEMGYDTYSSNDLRFVLESVKAINIQ